MAFDVGPVFKRNLNRGGLLLIVFGVAATAIGGGDVSSALETAATAASILGGVLVFIREMLN